MSPLTRKFALIYCVTALATSSCFLMGNGDADDEFQVLWAIKLPRATYFIGETISFTAMAYASTDPDLMIPGEMALITIRNESSVEVYSAWVTTNFNGSAPIAWESPLTSAIGNYTIILEPLGGSDRKITQNFMLLFNEETYWQTRVDLLEREIETQYRYLNELYSWRHWAERQVERQRTLTYITWAIQFLVLGLAAYITLPELARRSRNAKGFKQPIGSVLKMMGITSDPKIYLEHEEVANIEIPEGKRPFRFGHDHYCQVCEHKGLPRVMMTLSQLDDHLLLHDQGMARHGLKRWLAKRNQKALQAQKKEIRTLKHPPEPKPTMGTPEEIARIEKHDEKRKELGFRLKVIKKAYKAGKIDSKTLDAQLKKVKKELEELNTPQSSQPTDTLKQTPPSAPSLSPKPLEKKPLSGIPSALPKRITRTARILPPMNSAQDQIDSLYEKLNNEKVN